MKIAALLLIAVALASCEKLDSGYNYQKPYTKGEDAGSDAYSLSSSPQ